MPCSSEHSQKLWRSWASGNSQADFPASKAHFENNLAENEYLGGHSPDRLMEHESSISQNSKSMYQIDSSINFSSRAYLGTKRRQSLVDNTRLYARTKFTDPTQYELKVSVHQFLHSYKAHSSSHTWYCPEASPQKLSVANFQLSVHFSAALNTTIYLSLMSLPWQFCLL